MFFAYNQVSGFALINNEFSRGTTRSSWTLVTYSTVEEIPEGFSAVAARSLSALLEAGYPLWNLQMITEAERIIAKVRTSQRRVSRAYQMWTHLDGSPMNGPEDVEVAVKKMEETGEVILMMREDTALLDLSKKKVQGTLIIPFMGVYHYYLDNECLGCADDFFVASLKLTAAISDKQIVK